LPFIEVERKENSLFEGIYTALVTPMKKGTVDLHALEKIVDRQLKAGVSGVVACATTGEGSLLDAKERSLVIEAVVKQADKRASVIVGTGRVSTWATIEATRIAKDLGADAALVVAPSYVKPSQEGIAGHFEKVADDGGLPIVIYNVPSRTASDIEPATVGGLAAHEKIVGIKEATGSIFRVQKVIAAAAGRIAVLSGDDPITVSLLAAGGQGVICTGSNVVPERWTALWNLWKQGDVKGAAAAQAELRGLHEALFLESNPGPAKAALNLMGLIDPEIRSPLTWPRKTTLERLAGELKDLGVNLKDKA
jgi:4-hydroxy-tetrahydrodipicolinate synthase